MNGTINTSDRQLLADVHGWARTNGWNWHEAWGWINARYASEASLNVEWENGQLTVRRGTDGVFGRPIKYEVDSVREAVDMLVALNILPVRFSSLANTMLRLADELETEAAVHDAPAGSMFLDAGFRIRLTLDGEYEPTGDPR